MDTPRHFLDLDRFDGQRLRQILDLGAALKKGEHFHGSATPLAGRTLAMIFEKPSTRTRISFEVGMLQLGGHAVLLGEVSRGESLADAARVLSRYADAILVRTDAPSKLAELAQFASVPVINGLTDGSHPCQVMADVMTFEEHLGPIAGKTVAWCGDGNNMATSWVHAAARFGFKLRLACPEGLGPRPELLDWARSEGADVTLTASADEAVAGANAVNADTWVSMGDEKSGERLALLAPYQVDERLMSLAAGDAIFLHCLPAYREKEVTAAVIDGPRSVVWDEAENRLHAQKGILAWCMS